MWLLPNLLSLDAPIIAIIWQSLLANYASLPLRLTGRIVLGLTVWSIYIADRLLDVRQPAGLNESPRHRFYRAHRRLAAVFLVVISCINAVLVVFNLRHLYFGRACSDFLRLRCTCGYYMGARKRGRFLKNC